MRGRGLKPLLYENPAEFAKVAPHAGAWIETSDTIAYRIALNVAPHAGAWIETHS